LNRTDVKKNQYSGCKIIFFDAGTYVVTSTLQIPAGTQMVGEAWSVIAGKGSAFQSQTSPAVVVQVGAPGSTGILEISDIIFATIGASEYCKQNDGVTPKLIHNLQPPELSSLNGISCNLAKVRLECGIPTSDSEALLELNSRRPSALLGVTTLHA